MTSEALKQDDDFQHLESQINDEEPTQAANDAAYIEPAQPETRQIVQPLLEMGFAVLAPNWGVSQPEIEQLSGAYSDLLDKYFPDGLGDHGLEINAILITGAIVLPRLRMPRKQDIEAANDANYDQQEGQE